MAPVSKRGRKRVKRETRDYLNVTVDPATVDRLDALTREHGISRGRAVDNAVRVFMADRASGRISMCEHPGCDRIMVWASAPAVNTNTWACEEHAP